MANLWIGPGCTLKNAVPEALILRLLLGSAGRWSWWSPYCCSSLVFSSLSAHSSSRHCSINNNIFYKYISSFRADDRCIGGRNAHRGNWPPIYREDTNLGIYWFNYQSLFIETTHRLSSPSQIHQESARVVIYALFSELRIRPNPPALARSEFRNILGPDSETNFFLTNWHSK